MEAPDAADHCKAHAQSPEECMCKWESKMGFTQPTEKGGGLRVLLEVEMLRVRSSVKGKGRDYGEQGNGKECCCRQKTP